MVKKYLNTYRMEPDEVGVALVFVRSILLISTGTILNRLISIFILPLREN